MIEEITLPVKLEPILKQIQDNVPSMIKGRDAAVGAMEKIVDVNDDNIEEANKLLIRVDATYQKIYNIRTGITKSFDDAKEFLMQFEKDLSKDSKSNHVHRIRSLIGAHNQKKIDENKRVQEQARIQKGKENYKAEIIARIKKNLADMVIERVRKVQDGSRDYFNACTLDDFDKRAQVFKSNQPKLKTEEWSKCFMTEINKSLITDEAYAELCLELQKEETYEKWNETVITAIMPKINEWIGRIPELKDKLIALKNASDEEAKKKLLAEQETKAKKEDEERQLELNEMKKLSDEQIERDKEVEKLQNDFREQAVTQKLEDAGPVKLLLKFKDEKPVKAITEMVYHCFMNEKFPPIQKKNKAGELQFDEHGFPIYVDWVDTLVKFFVKYCDTGINGIELKEVSRVIVRK